METTISTQVKVSEDKTTIEDGVITSNVELTVVIQGDVEHLKTNGQIDPWKVNKYVLGHVSNKLK